MGWGDCGNDSKGRPIGYVFEATCDAPGCDRKIDRGLSYACGGMHGEQSSPGDAWVCEGYFCPDHLVIVELKEPDDRGQRVVIGVCRECAVQLEAEDGDA